MHMMNTILSVRQLSEHRGQSVWTALGVAAAVPGLAFMSAGRFAPIVIGLVILQAVTGLPVTGGLLGLPASLVGVGALVARSWSLRQRTLPAGLPAPASA